MSNWNEIEPSRLWTLENCLSADILTALIDGAQRNLEKCRSRSSLLESPKFAYSSFQYWQVPTEKEQIEPAFLEILEKIKLLEIYQEKTRDLAYSKTSQAFLKAFSNQSHYDLHTEDSSVFGDIVYILYLTDEKACDLTFPTKEYITQNIAGEELLNWGLMRDKLLGEKKNIYYCNETINITPRVNKCVAFRTGLVHKVGHYNKTQLGRICLTGFPFATIK